MKKLGKNNARLCFTLLLLLVTTGVSFSQNSGTLDLTFGNNGKVITQFNPDLYARMPSVSRLQADDKILTITVVRHTSQPPQIQIFRHLPDGSVDNSWGQNGVVTTTIPGASNIWVRDMQVQPNGSILLYGYRDSLLVNNNFVQMGLLLRYLPNGLIDNNFGNNGVVIQSNSTMQIPLFQNVFGWKIALLPDEIITFATDSINAIRIQSYSMSDGSLNTNFGTNCC